MEQLAIEDVPAAGLQSSPPIRANLEEMLPPQGVPYSVASAAHGDDVKEFVRASGAFGSDVGWVVGGGAAAGTAGLFSNRL